MTAITTNSKINLLVGPSGRAIAQPMEKELVEAFYQHLSMERSAHAFYFGISIWFAERELRGFSQYFKKESLSENEHAATIAEYLIARGQTVSLYDLPSPKQDFTSIEEIITYSFQLESDVTTSLQQLYSMAERSSDTRTTVFLDPTIEAQIESEDEFAYLLGRVKLADNEPSALLIIDSEIKEG